MKPYYLVTLLCLLIFGCGSKRSETRQTDSLSIRPLKHITTDTVKAEEEYVVDTTHIILNNTANRFFSDTAAKDSFSVTFYGKNARNGTVVLEIFKNKHQRIYKHLIAAGDLLLDYDLLDPKKQLDTIRVKMLHMFDKENFSKPAIAADEKIEDDFDEPDNKKDWLEIKADKTAIGFTHQYNYEAITSIAFSKKQQKVITIFYRD